MAAYFDFTGRVALVTGAASGIGAATARWLDRHGVAELVLVDMDRPGLDLLGLKCKITPYGGDVGDPSLWNLLERNLPPIDHAVLNAGIATTGNIVDLDIATWRKTMAVNLDGMFLSLRAALRSMKKNGRGGSVVMTASASGLKAAAGTAAYASSKAAIVSLPASRRWKAHSTACGSTLSRPVAWTPASGTRRTGSRRWSNSTAEGTPRLPRWRVMPRRSAVLPAPMKWQARSGSCYQTWRRP